MRASPHQPHRRGRGLGVITLTILLVSGCLPDSGPSLGQPQPDGGGDLFPQIDWTFRSDSPAAKQDGAPAPQQDGGAPAPDGPVQITRQQLAAHWAPVWHQDTDSSNYKGDYIVAYDFDGDTRSDNNWDNLKQAGVNLGAVIYYSVVETNTHWFITYTDFHPQDWDENCKPIPFGPDRCHENDMEGAMVVVRKDGSTFGAFLLLYTEAHNKLYIFSNNKSLKPFHSNRLQSVPVTFEQGSHPELYVESKGHGVCALRYSGGEHCKHPTSGNPPPFPGGDGVIYRYKGKAETPKSGNDPNVGYALVSFETAIWARRNNICDSGCTFDGKLTYEGQTVGKAFDGDNHGNDKARPPWSWDDPDDGPVYTGDWFFRPAESLLTHLKGVPTPCSKTYVYNPYLGLAP